MNAFKFILLTATAMFVTAVVAQEQPITVVTQAEKEEVFLDEEGVERTRLVPAATIIPGDKVVYTITFSNRGNESASNITIVDPIPDQMRYVAGTAAGPGTDIAFSADNGENYASADEVFVSDADGNQRLATAAEYTHIRWVLKNPLEPSTQAYAKFKAELR